MPLVAAAAQTYAEYLGHRPWKAQIRDKARDAALFMLSRLRPSSPTRNWIRFPYYHHVFDDEREGFAKQLAYMRNIGEFLSMDEALECLRTPGLPKGRFFCITFDDGFRNCLTNAVPILLDHGAKAAFFVPTRYIGSSAEKEPELHERMFGPGKRPVEFLDWNECKQMIAAGMTIGSHTVGHSRLSEISEMEVERELRESKETIERELGIHCEHFCCPWGRPGIDCSRNREPEIAKRVGYSTFLTTLRGTNAYKPSPLFVTRDHLLAQWGLHQLQYFLSR